MCEPLLEELSRAFAALIIHDANSYTFARKTIRVGAEEGVITTGQDPLAASLQNTLYQYAYSHRFTGRLDGSRPFNSPSDDLTVTLSKANNSRDRWISGWSVLEVLPTGQVAAQRHGKTRLLWPGEFLAHGAAGATKRGTRVTLFWKRESTALQAGFYFAFGEAVPDHGDEMHYVRFYWHVQAGLASSLLQVISADLNRFQIPFRFKFLNQSGFYGRTDAAVLYTARRHYRITIELLAKLYPKLREGLGAETPLFTKPLAPGLGCAEDPGNGESFGMNRCRLVAEAIVEAFRAGLQTTAARLDATSRRFRDAGCALATPYLNSSTNDEFLWPND